MSVIINYQRTILSIVDGLMKLKVDKRGWQSNTSKSYNSHPPFSVIHLSAMLGSLAREMDNMLST
jgi:hypothetical protein